MKGTIADRWDADLSYSYAEGKTTEHTNGGFFLYSRLLPILNSGQIDLTTVNLPADQLALLHQSDFIADVFSGKSSTSAVNAKVSGDLFRWAPARSPAPSASTCARRSWTRRRPARIWRVTSRDTAAAPARSTATAT